MKKITLLVAIVFVASAVVSCHQHHHDADSHEHEHHHNVEQVVVYTPDYEIFAEMPTLVVGEKADIAAYFTLLSTYKPLEDAAVTMLYSCEGEEQSQSLDKPNEPGIYRFSLTPTKAGHANLSFEVSNGDSVVTIYAKHLHVAADHNATHSCGHDHGHDHAHDHGHDHAHATPAESFVTFTKEQSWKVDFGTEVVELTNFGQLIRAAAQVLPSQGDERQVVAKTSGIVVFDANMVEGTAVSKGQKLFTVESSGMADNNMDLRFKEALSNYTLAKEEYERKQQLATDKIVSQAELQRAKNAYESAKAIYYTLKDNFATNGERANAPLGGYIKTVHLANGSYVEAGQPIVTISQNRDLYIRAEVQPRYYTNLAHIEDVTFKVGNHTYTLKELGGSLVSYGRATEEGSSLLPITFRVRNTADMVSGSFVTTYIRCSSAEQVLTIANGGIVEEMGHHFVFVQHNPEQFEKRMVTLGATDGLRSVVLTGLKANERVVSKGAMMIKLGQAAGALDPHAGHVH